MLEKIKQNKMGLVIFIISLLLIVVGVSYSLYEVLFVGRKEQIIQIGGAGGLTFRYNETTNGLSLSESSILNDNEGISQNKYFDFEVSLSSTRETKINYKIALEEDSGNTLSNEKVRIYLTDQNNNVLVSSKSINELENEPSNNNYKILYQKTISQNETNRYRLRAWIDDTKVLYTTANNEGSHTFQIQEKIYKFKVNVYTALLNGADALITLTDNENESGLYTITHEADSTLQIGATEPITEYRYRGASPKNYVTFNNETWRIIGVFPVDDGTGNIENRIKIIKDQSIGNKYWNSNQTSNWTGATLKTELNGTYYNGLNNTSQNMIENTKYYLGGYSASTQTSVDMYSYERKISGSTYYYGSQPNNWVGKIGLMYVSDYGYASSNCETKSLYNSSSASNDLRACNNTNWLYNGAYQWLLPQYSSSSSYAFRVNSSGFVNYYNVYDVQLGLRPVLYLASAVQITGGSGTSSSPYTLGR